MSELDQLMTRITAKYPVETVPLKIGAKVMNILQMKDYEDYIINLVDTEDLGVADVPFWAKLWEASFVLAYFLGRQPVVPGQRVLEIGAGIGVVGVYGAVCGHNMTITDINDDALLFARANALINGAPQAAVMKLDWNTPDLVEPYPVIVGSEVIYDRKCYPLLVSFLDRALAPGGTVFLAKNADMPTPAFFAELTTRFAFKETTQTCQVDGEDQKICIYAIRRKTEIERHGGRSPCPRPTSRGG